MLLIYNYTCRKPKLPIEVEMSEKQKDDESKDSVDCWDPDEIVQHALKMSKVKEAIYVKAKQNIDTAQKKDKEYYDKKHADPEVS